MSTTSRPMTPAPGSPSSLHNATTTIDDLTIAFGLKVDAEPASDGQLGQTPYTSPLLSVQSPENKRTEEQVDARVAELVRENAVLEKVCCKSILKDDLD
ncbi:hypothetical protein PHLCEN_2v4734 [Hermanssonia centrifuga]|uniref:Uncharacterized protein n=1 Tax=Hermanssonia centrifuga TaxID=98765 RepID=A0A2R6PJG4_9APHY|nr:hypothetical protein PHLCEN_2v4734 [Hermanssonia centrifuga]